MSTLAFKTLTLKNFKSFREKTVIPLDRPPGLYYIAGQNLVEPELGANGVGKSTILDGILWALYGKTGRDNRPANSVQSWEIESGSTRVELVLNDNHIVRARRPNSLSLDGKEVEQTEIDKLVGMSEAMFRRTVILSQFGTLFLDLKPEAQSQMFTEALNLDVWLEASDKANEAHKGFQSDIAAVGLLRMNAEGRLLELQKQIKYEIELRDEFDTEKEERLAKEQSRLAKLETRYQALPNASTNDLTELRQKLQQTERARSDVRTDYQTAIRAIAQLADDRKQYQKAIAGNRACPACGQTASTKHLQQKLTDLQTKHDKEVELQTKAGTKLSQLDRLLEEARTKVRDRERAVGEHTNIKAELSIQRAVIKEIQSSKNKHLDSLIKLRQRKEEQKNQIAQYDEQLKENEQAAGVAEYWISAFKEIRLNIIDHVLDELSMAATNHAEALGLNGWAIEFKTEKLSKAGSISLAFNVLLFPPGQKEPVKWESYSGGESQRWQLAVTFGMAEIVLARAGVNPNVEFYDEPTRGLSTEGINSLLEQLADRAGNLGRTIYIVDHHSLPSGNFVGYVNIIKDNRGSRIN